MQRKSRILHIASMVLTAPLFLVIAGCPDGGAEEAGETVDEALEDTGEAIDDAAENVEDAAEDAG